MRQQLLTVLTAMLLLWLSAAVMGQDAPPADRRTVELRHLDYHYAFPGYRTKEEWQARAAHLRRQILFSAGLWPMPAKTPLKARVFGLTDHGDYTVEKVYFESYPGHYVTGNLYRPKHVAGKAPAVLLPHGHWTYGRFENTPTNSGPLRGVNFARLGFVAFAWDMEGYNDSAAVNHKYAGDELWAVNVLGLQLWNAVRAVDFVASLPDVDAERIGCTGESGGGTQTFLLTAVDDRIKVSAPVNMISSIMQGGDICENAPNLRVDAYNVEFGAMMAPRPMLMVSATGDWTRYTPTVEYPAIQSVYRLFGAEDRVQTVQMDAPHNYNQASREAVYGWFAHWLQGRDGYAPIKEKGSSAPQLQEMLVFLNQPRPANELSEQSFIASRVAAAKSQFAAALPRDAAGVERFREEYGAALRYSLLAESPQPGDVIASRVDDANQSFLVSRRNRGDLVRLQVTPATGQAPVQSVVLVASPPLGEAGTQAAGGLREKLRRDGHVVVWATLFPGRDRDAEPPTKYKFFTGYNRTDAANAVQDVLTSIAWVRQQYPQARLTLIGRGTAGLPTLLARGLASRVDRMAVDVAQFDYASDEAFAKHLLIPGIRRAGDFTTAVAVAPLTPLLIYNTGGHFRSEAILDLYRRLGKAQDFRAQPEAASEAGLADWVKAVRTPAQP